MSAIQWTDETYNPIVGCSRISAGCKNCYAADAAKSARLQQFPQYQKVKDWNGVTEFVESQLLKPLSWKKPKKVFVCSMSDLFHESVPFEWIDQIFAVMAIAPQHTFQILTKRPKRMLEYFLDYRCDMAPRWVEIQGTKQVIDLGRSLPLPNVMLGVSVENQQAAGDRIPLLLQAPATKRFLSCEPLLELVSLKSWLRKEVGKGVCSICKKDSILYVAKDSIEKLAVANKVACLNCLPFIDWVICGGESGAGARPCHINWLRSLVKQCNETSTKVFVKQLGSVSVVDSPIFLEGIGIKSSYAPIKLRDRKGGNIEEFPEDLRVREFPL